MSHATIYSWNSRTIDDEWEAECAPAGAPVVWEGLSKRFLDTDGIDPTPLWDACNEGKLPRWATLLTLSTYDRVWVPKDLIVELADAWMKFYTEHVQNHWGESRSFRDRRPRVRPTTLVLATGLYRAAAKGAHAVSFEHTSVSGRQSWYEWRDNDWHVRDKDPERRIDQLIPSNGPNSSS